MVKGDFSTHPSPTDSSTEPEILHGPPLRSLPLTVQSAISGKEDFVQKPAEKGMDVFLGKRKFHQQPTTLSQLIELLPVEVPTQNLP